MNGGVFVLKGVSMENKTLQQISVANISANPFNPRLIFDREDLDDLKKSISKVGILVPLTVYRNTKSYPKTEYILLDGERRWRCANELGMADIPANIIDEPSDDTQNIMFMFNIHHFRREWELFPTALKLETLIEKLGTDQESQLSSFTGVSRSMIRRCKTLLWFPKKYREILMEKGGKISTDFFIEIYPLANRLSSEDEYFYPHGTIKLVDGLMNKFLLGEVITDVKDFREIRRAMSIADKAEAIPEFKTNLAQFIENQNCDTTIFAPFNQDSDREPKNILKYLMYLNESLSKVDIGLINDFNYIEQIKLLENRLSNLLVELE